MNAEGEGPYAASRALVISEYAAFVSGSPAGLFVCVFDDSCSPQACDAVAKSAAALGYGLDGVTFVKPSAGLEAADLYRLVEGLDPLALVCLGQDAAQLLAQAYRLAILPGAPARIQGRDARVLLEPDSMLQTPAGKQHLWQLLKSLPNLSE